MKALTALLWIITIVTGFYGTLKAISETSHATGKSVWHLLFSGREYYVWHGAPGWYYPTLIALTAVTVGLTALHVFSRQLSRRPAS